MKVEDIRLRDDRIRSWNKLPCFHVLFEEKRRSLGCSLNTRLSPLHGVRWSQHNSARNKERRPFDKTLKFNADNKIVTSDFKKDEPASLAKGTVKSQR